MLAVHRPISENFFVENFYESARAGHQPSKVFSVWQGDFVSRLGLSCENLGRRHRFVHLFVQLLKFGFAGVHAVDLKGHKGGVFGLAIIERGRNVLSTGRTGECESLFCFVFEPTRRSQVF